MHVVRRLPHPAVTALCALALVAAALSTAVARADGPGGPVPNSLQQAYHALRVPNAAALAAMPNPANAEVELPEGVDPLVVQGVQVHPTKTVWEPTVGVTGQGTVFTTSDPLDGTELGTEILRSKDGGLTWDSVQPRIPGTQRMMSPVSLDPYVYVDDTTGRVFTFDLYVACNYLMHSDDQGDTWQHNPIACGDITVDHQTFVAGPPPASMKSLAVLYPNFLYYCSNRVADSKCARSVDGGRTFLPTASPAYLGYDPAKGLCGGLHGHVAVAPNGSVLLPRGYCGEPYIAVSTDAGDTWTRTRVSDINSAHNHMSVAADAAGNLYFVWFESGRGLPFLSVSRDNGKTWGTPMMIAPPGVTQANFPTVEAGDEGHIAISFPATTGARTDGRRPWNHYAIVSTNALDDNPLFLSATANDPKDPILRGSCGGSRCAGIGDFIDVEISPAGELWAAGTDGCIGSCVTGNGGNLSRGRGLNIRQIGGPKLRTVPAGG